MPALAELEPVSSHAAIWHAYDRSVKADLFSTALFGGAETFLIDPIPLARAGLEQLRTGSPMRGIIVTNQNHWRSASQLRQQLSIPIFAHPGAAESETGIQFSAVEDGEPIHKTVRVIKIDGAAPGEIALFSEAKHGVLVVGDALINFEPYGFVLLPDKYCIDQKIMRNSLARLLDHHFEAIFFAHGFPILINARGRLESLLKSE